MIPFDLDEKIVEQIIINALKEDIQTGDVTTESIITNDTTAKAKFIAKADGIISGMFIAENVFRKLSNNVSFELFYRDGDSIMKNDIAAIVEAPIKVLLSGERTALNFMQRMSGIATATNKFVKAVEGTKAQILDTRKTTPGLRLLDKYAVKCGGGMNHRIGLFDMILIKDNHIKVAGSITEAYNRVIEKYNDKYKIEIETSNLAEVEEAIKCNPDVIMLDNMNLDLMKNAVTFINGKTKTEASGNITLENVKPVAETGVDFISIGALTHSVQALDLSMKIIQE